MKRWIFSASTLLARATRTNSASFCSCVWYLLAQHFDLALDQRHGRAIARMLQPQARQQLWMALEEIGVVLQVLCDRLFLGRLRRQAAHLIARHPVVSCHLRSLRSRRVLRRLAVPGPVSQTDCARSVPVYAQHAAGHTHLDVCAEQSELPADDRGGACTGAAGARLADAALVDAQADVAAIEHLHEADVDLSRKARARSAARGRCARPGRSRPTSTRSTACGLPIETAPSSMRLAADARC